MTIYSKNPDDDYTGDFRGMGESNRLPFIFWKNIKILIRSKCVLKSRSLNMCTIFQVLENRNKKKNETKKFWSI